MNARLRPASQLSAHEAAAPLRRSAMTLGRAAHNLLADRLSLKSEINQSILLGLVFCFFAVCGPSRLTRRRLFEISWPRQNSLEIWAQGPFRFSRPL